MSNVKDPVPFLDETKHMVQEKVMDHFHPFPFFDEYKANDTGKSNGSFSHL